MLSPLPRHCMTQPATAVEKGAMPHPLGWANLTQCTIQPSNDTTNKRESQSWTLTCTVQISKTREKKRRLSFSGSQTEAQSRMKLEVESLKPQVRGKRKLNLLDETTTPLAARPSLRSRATSRQHGNKLTRWRPVCLLLRLCCQNVPCGVGQW
jgi:hypothetical protein